MAHISNTVIILSNKVISGRKRVQDLREYHLLRLSLTAQGKGVLSFNSFLTGSLLHLFAITDLQTQFSDCLENLYMLNASCS